MISAEAAAVGLSTAPLTTPCPEGVRHENPGQEYDEFPYPDEVQLRRPGRASE